MKTPYGHIILFIFFLILGVAQAQDYTIRDIKINPNGESHKDINVMQVDHNGFLWYSTYNGVVKDFETHSVLSTFMDENGDNPPKIAFTVFIDNQQRMWVSTQTGVFVSDKSLDDSFNRIKFKPFSRGENLSGNSYIEDCDGNIWIVGADNVILKVDSSFAVEKYQIEALKPTYAVSDYYKREFLFFEKIIDCDKILCRQGRKLFILEKGEISLIADYTSTKKYETMGYFHPEWTFNGGDGILISPNGELLPKSKEIQYTYKGKVFESYFIKDLDIQVLNLPFQEMIPITEDGNPILKDYADFIGIDGLGKNVSLYKMMETNGNYMLRKTYEIPFPFWVEDLVVDKNDIIYVSNYDHIKKIKFNKNNFERILYGNGKSVISTRGLLELPNNEILVATYSGVFKITPTQSDFIHGSYVTENVFPQLSYLRSFVKASDSTAWCLGENRMVSEINFLENTIIGMYNFDKDWELGQLRYYDVLKKSDSTLLLASNFGLQEFNIWQKKFRELPIPLVENTKKLFIRDLHKTGNKLYIGTDANGLFIQDLNSDTFLHLNNDSTDNGLTLPTNKIYTILKDKREILWLGTDKGLIYFDKDLKKATILDEADGLTNLNVVGVLEDAEKNIWFSTYDGLYRYERDVKKITSFYEEDGLTFNDFNQNAYYKTSSNTLFFGGIRGLIVFDHIDNPAPLKELQIFPTKFEYYDTHEEKEVEIDVLNQGNYSFSLPYNKNSFSVTYSINDCYNTENNKYVYRLDGFTDDWVNLGKQNTLKLLSIPPGDYVLRIKGFDSAGVESSNELHYYIHVAQVFYRQSWFLILSGFLSVAVLLFLVLSYTKKVKKKYALNLALIELERKTLISQMNPHFIFNALNEIRNRLRNGKTKGLEHYVTLFSKLARLTLDVTRNERIQLAKEIDFIKSYVTLSNIDNTDDVDLIVKCGNNIDTDDLVIPPMILQPIIENSIVHGFTKDQTEKKIVLKIEKSTLSQQLIFSIKDNGLGIATTKKTNNNQHQSYASQILKERLNLMNQINQRNGEYEIRFQDLSDEQRTGTKVIVKVPYTRI
ncbi:histidine kinase [Flagellimonas pacifica]|uniref:histidine kinase n=1 Tax=Flagellimonas pacifica TaxID=1247520 RepID=UPI001054BEEE|nr:histidine kinase [Allomuricauda parva]